MQGNNLSIHYNINKTTESMFYLEFKSLFSQRPPPYSLPPLKQKKKQPNERKYVKILVPHVKYAKTLIVNSNKEKPNLLAPWQNITLNENMLYALKSHYQD